MKAYAIDFDGRPLFSWADEQYERLPALAMELARRQPAAIVAVGGPAAALAAKAASTTILTVFSIAGDPVNLGLVASVNRLGGNATGVSTVFSSVAAKQLETLHEMLPKATLIGCLVNPKNPNAGTGTREAQAVHCFRPRTLLEFSDIAFSLSLMPPASFAC